MALDASSVPAPASVAVPEGGQPSAPEPRSVEVDVDDAVVLGHGPEGPDRVREILPGLVRAPQVDERMELIATAHVDSPFSFTFSATGIRARQLVKLERATLGSGQRTKGIFLAHDCPPRAVHRDCPGGLPDSRSPWQVRCQVTH